MRNVPFAAVLAKTNLDAANNIFSGIGANFIFEVELDKSEPFIDFSTCILKNEMQTLLEHWQKEDIKRVLKNNEKWQRVLRFCSEWARPGSLPGTNIKNIWFEFDNIQLSKELPEPCLFFSTHLLSTQPESGKVKNRKLNLNWLFEGALEILIPERMADDFVRKVEDCIFALPPKGAIFQIGFLLSRSVDSLRICTTMRTDKYQEYLKKIKWPGSYEYLEPALQTFSQYTDGIFLDIDVKQDVLAKIGMECCFRNNDDTKPKLLEFFDLLIELNLCIEKNAKLIIDWLNGADKQETYWGKSGLKRGLSHIKIILDEDNTAAAKAYLSLSDWDKNMNLAPLRSAIGMIVSRMLE
jgi:hypothetical protein